MLFLFCCVYFHLKMKTIKQKQKILELKVDKYKLLKEKNEIKSLDKQTREETEVRNSDIYKQLMMAIDKQEYHLAEEDWEEIQKLVNRAYENFDSNLRGFLDVTPQEYKICLLIKMKISPTNIARFVNLTKEAITASRRRMYTKAFGKKGRPSDWDNIIKSL
jgi:protein subunit release factor A